MSVKITTAGQAPLPAGWKKAASQVPSAVVMLTSVSTTSAARAWPARATPVAMATVEKPRRVRRESRSMLAGLSSSSMGSLA